MRIIEINSYDEDILCTLEIGVSKVEQEMEEIMKLVNKVKKNNRIEELETNIRIQISNNRMLREELTKEREFSKEQALEIAKLKKNIAILSKDNEEMAKMIVELRNLIPSNEEDMPRVEEI